jgi:hypothetical protein
MKTLGGERVESDSQNYDKHGVRGVFISVKKELCPKWNI